MGISGYGRTFGILGHQASVLLVVPYVWGDISGEVFEEARSVTRSGIGDTRLRLAVNLIGGEALTPKEFMQRTPRTTLGASLSITTPTGQYDPDKLINIGTNRWAFKPEIGITQPLDRWFFEAYAGVWFFTHNDNYSGGTRREQQSVTALQAHVSYTFRPHLWLAGDVTYYRGGKTSIDGVWNANLQENLRMGLTLSVPLTAPSRAGAVCVGALASTAPAFGMASLTFGRSGAGSSLGARASSPTRSSLCAMRVS